jgi:Fur family transcriptional regulator, iron response regulator
LPNTTFRLSLGPVKNLMETLRQYGIQPTPQRLEVARYILECDRHFSAEQALAIVTERCPTISRATVYNTLNILVEKGLVAARVLREGAVVFDSRVSRHHHLIDIDTDEIHDIDWGKLKVSGTRSIDGFEVQDYHVVLRGRKK